MFGAIRRTFGLIKVTESVDQIEVSGVPAEVIARDISKIWNSSRINTFMFVSISKNGFRFPKFFAVEIHYMLGQIDEYRYSRTSVRTIRHIQHELEQNTWLKSINEEHPPRLDLSKLSELTISLEPHQDSFLNVYNDLPSKYGLRGYLLSADPGTGKAQPLDAPIRIPGGWSTMGEMTVGTKVIAKDGSVTEVTGVYPQGEKLIYRVTFADGRTAECCGEHLWKVQWCGNNKTPSTDVLQTQTIAQFLKEGNNAFHIPLIDPEMDSSAERQARLQKLLNTDEIASEYGSVYVSTNEALACEVQQLAWSLGAIAILSDVSDEVGYLYQVDIEWPSSSKSLMLKIVAIEPIGVKPAQCIAIDHMERLYVTGDYIATHNTFMGLALSHCAGATVTVIVSPKNALDSVWGHSIVQIFKKPKPFWMANGDKPYRGEPVIVTNYEAIPKAISAAQHANHSRAVVILDESHNLNEVKSNRTQAFLELCKVTHSNDILWSSGSPLKAMGYEMVPLLRSLDPLFTSDVELRFVKIFGKESGRALDILRNRIGKVSFHVAAADVVANESDTQSIKIQLSNGHDYTLEAIREKMRAFVAERLAYYEQHFKRYKRDYDDGLDAFERQMNPDLKSDFRKYQQAIKEIRRGYDPVAHKEIAAFANTFEKKVIIPGIPDKGVRDAFKNAKSVVKYYQIRVVGEALGTVLGKARAQCHVEMVPHIDWKGIFEKSEKKVLIFTSYVEVVKAISKELDKLGLKHILVYGDTNSNVAGLMKQLSTDDSIRGAVATYMSLSTAVPVTAANTTVFVNAPFRHHELKQAKARTDRMGQDAPVHFVFTTLDTGEAPNISTRSHDILEWSKAMVEQLTGLSEGIAAELNKDYTKGAMEHYIEPGTMFGPAFETLYEQIALENLTEEDA